MQLIAKAITESPEGARPGRPCREEVYLDTRGWSRIAHCPPRPSEIGRLRPEVAADRLHAMGAVDALARYFPDFVPPLAVFTIPEPLALPAPVAAAVAIGRVEEVVFEKEADFASPEAKTMIAKCFAVSRAMAEDAEIAAAAPKRRRSAETADTAKVPRRKRAAAA